MASFTMNSNHTVLWMAFIDQGEFEAMKMLSGWETARCAEHSFRAKIKVSAWIVFKFSLFDKVVWTKNMKNGTFATAHFCV